MLIKYFLYGSEYASRTRDFVPRKDEVISFHGIRYLIDHVAWVEDQERAQVHINIIKDK